MTTYLGKCCAFRKLPSFYVFSYFPFGFEGRMCDLIVSVPDHCLSFYLFPYYYCLTEEYINFGSICIASLDALFAWH